MSAADHPTDDLQLLVEGNLPAVRNDALRDHLSACATCRAELDALRQVRSALREGLPRVAVPEELSSRIRTALAEEARRSSDDGDTRLSVSRRTFVLRGAALAAAAGIGALLFRFRPRDLVAQAETDFVRFASQQPTLEVPTSDPAILERYLRAGDLAFEARVFDFGMMGYALVGGGFHSAGGRDAALFAYRGADGRGLVCQMYLGSLDELSEPSRREVIDGIEFGIYDRGALTLVFWEEGPVLCALTAEAAASAALELAVAKAVRV